MKRLYIVVTMLLFVVTAIAQVQTTNLHGFATGSSMAGNGNTTSTIIGEPFTGILMNNGYETTTGLAQAQLEVMEVEATVNYGEGYYENGFSYPATTPVGTYTASLYSPLGGNYHYDLVKKLTLTVEPGITCNPITLPYKEDFDGYAESTTAATGVEPTCWELVRTDAPSMPDNKRPQVYYNNTFAHSGSYSLQMNYRCVYAMPEISGDVLMSKVKLEMYLTQPNTAYQLQVGVWDDATNTFEPVALFKNSNSKVTHVKCDFSNYSGNGRRVAFRNVLKSGVKYAYSDNRKRIDVMQLASSAYSYNYLDDIILSLIDNNKSAEVTTTDGGILAADRDLVDVIVYPNPTRDVVNVECTMNNVQLKGVEVIDVYGKVVRNVVGANNDSPTQINVSNLAAGMYFVRVTTDKGAVTKPFVKR